VNKRAYHIVNGITFYRLLAVPLLLFLIFTGRASLFKWFLAISFFTDALDGFLARRLKVTSEFGSKLDSVADDLTFVAAIVGVVVLKPHFLQHHLFIVIGLAVLFIIETVFALVKYGRMSSFHTYSAKGAAILQDAFLLLLFFLPQPPYVLFYIASFVTAIDLIEEIILIYLLPKWEADVKGLIWVLKKRVNK
jgi:phosphatidylglycerophosphate synthase